MSHFTSLRNKLRYLPVGRMLYGGFGVLLLLTGLIGAIALVSIQRVDDRAHELAAKWLAGYEHLTVLRTEIRELREFEVKHAGTENQKNQKKYEAEMARLSKSIGDQAKAYEALVKAEAELTQLGALKAALTDYADFSARVVALGNESKQSEAQDMSDFGAKTAFNKSVEALVVLIAANGAGGQAAGAEADRVAGQATVTLQALLAAALAMGLLLAWAITSRLLAQLGGEPRAAVLLTRAVADGDLTSQVTVLPGDGRSLMARLEAMQISLVNTVSEVRQTAEGVATASVQIAQGNQDLSARTEQQASALQQTAATMDELGTTVRNNADNARQANQLAQGASTVAVKGGEVVGQVVETMKGINDSSKKIADIISVIDGIAFQTNILALNAAVEAARAGEQGRGFAVVASEVRSLAQRSAEAAKEIKGLIDNSVQRVHQGTVLVDQAGDTMKEVVAAIQRVTDIVGEISAASHEQSTGVAQVGQAISQLDENTQRNAALVEESAAAAESMRQQAAQLVQAVAVFRISSAASMAPTLPAMQPVPVERRGPNRPLNVTRLPAPSATKTPAAAATGTDDWQSF